MVIAGSHRIASRRDLDDIMKRVDLYLSVERFDAAEKLLKATLSDMGPLANVHNKLGVTYHMQSLFIEALTEFNQALKANPKFVEAALNLTITLCDLSLYDEAREAFDSLNDRLDPKKRQPDLVLGRLANCHADNGKTYEESGMIAEAIAEYRKALGLYPDMPDVKLALAKCYIRISQFEKARSELEDVVKMDRGLPNVHTWLGVLYYKLGRKDLARRQWEKARELDTNAPAARAYLKISSDWPLEADTTG